MEALRVLQDARADLSHADNYGWTPAHSAAAGGHVEALREVDVGSAVDVLLIAAQNCTRSSLLGARLLGVQRCALRLLLSAVRQGDSTLTPKQSEWRKAMSAIRTTCKQRAAQARAGTSSKTVAMSASLLDLYLTCVELTLTHLKAKDDVLSVGKSVGMLVIGAVKSVAMTRLDGMLLEGLQQTAGIALDVTRRSITRACFVQLALIEQLAVSADTCMFAEDFPALMHKLRWVHDQHFKLGSTGIWEPITGRWEPKAAFAALLADLLVGIDGSFCSFHTLPSADVKMICLGTRDFIGLNELMSLGNDRNDRSSEEPSLVSLAVWAQSLFTNCSSFDAWLSEGFEILCSEARRVGEERVDALLTEVKMRLAEQLGTAVQQLKNLNTDSTHHERHQARTALAALCQEAEAMRAAAQKVQAAAERVLPVAERAKKLLHTVGGLSTEDVAVSALWMLTTRLQQHCAVQTADKDDAIQKVSARLGKELEKIPIETPPAATVEAGKQPELGRRWEAIVEKVPDLEEVAKEVQDAVCLRLRALQGEFRQGLALAQVCQALLQPCLADQRPTAPWVEKGKKLEALLRNQVAPRLQQCVRCVQSAGEEKRSADVEKQSAGEEKRSADEQKRSTGDEKRSAGDEKRSAGDEKRSAGEEKRSAGEEKR
ncbi:hypothetical protein CYMTET_46213, partial [Cymbomonas tetramitiformis]